MCTDGRTDIHHEPNTRFTEICVVPDIVHSVIYSLEQISSTEDNMFSASQEIHRQVSNPKAHFRRHKYPPPVPILIYFDPVYVPRSHFLKIRLNCEPALYRLLTFHVPNITSHFRCTKESVQVWGLLIDCFVTQSFFKVRNCSSSLNPQSGRTPLFRCPRLLIQYIRS